MPRVAKPIPIGKHVSGWDILKEIDKVGKHRMVSAICPCGRVADARYHKLSVSYRCKGCKSERRSTTIEYSCIIDIYTVLTELPKKGKHRVFTVSCNLCYRESDVYLSNMRRGNKGCIHCRDRTGKPTHQLASKDEYGNRDPVYDKWFRVRDRCYNPNNEAYSDYGGRGITMSNEFLESKEAWVTYLKELPNFGEDAYYSIDRIDNNGNYERGNLRWATRSMQMRNRRPRSQWKKENK